MPFTNTDSRTNYTTQMCITPKDGESSHTKNFPNGVPQVSVLSPTLFNINMHDTPPTPSNTNITLYADDFTIISTHNGCDDFTITSTHNYQAT